MSIIKENPGSLLVSGNVLHESIEKTFKDFAIRYLNEDKSKENVQISKNKAFSNVFGAKNLKSLNELMLDENEESPKKKRPHTASSGNI